MLLRKLTVVRLPLISSGVSLRDVDVVSWGKGFGVSMWLGLTMRRRRAVPVSLMRHAVRAALRLPLVDAAELSLLSSADGKDLGQDIAERGVGAKF